jgi:DNA-3-methyladenine glycosylase I
VSTPDYAAYHDEEWGRAVHGERGLYERFTLEAFQSGLSWLTILRKREAFRSAFAGFDAEVVARYRAKDRTRLMADTGIVRNNAKIDAAIANAAAVLRMRETGGLDELVWSHAPTGRQRAPRSFADVRAKTPESIALAKALKRNGFVFVGPTTAYAAMQSLGVVNDHLRGCHVRAACEQDRAATTIPR